MILSEVVAIALSIIGFLLSLQGLWLVCRALWPNKVEQASRRCEQRPIASFFTGLAVTLLFVLSAVTVSKAGAPGQMGAFVILFFFVIFSAVGTAGFVTHIGRRLESPADVGRPWRATVRGGVALQLAYLIPVLGWFGILGFSLIIGAGSATLALFSRREKARLPLPVDLEPPMFPGRRAPAVATQPASMNVQEVMS